MDRYYFLFNRDKAWRNFQKRTEGRLLCVCMCGLVLTSQLDVETPDCFEKPLPTLSSKGPHALLS